MADQPSNSLANICRTLDQEFSIDQIFDDWSFSFDEQFRAQAVKKFLVEKGNTGLFLQFSNVVSHIYTAFAPSKYVLQEIKQRGSKNALLVLKHPFDWNGSANGQGFIRFGADDYKLMKEMELSLYSLHTPWDKNRNDTFVSTAYGFARAIGFQAQEEFGEDPANPKLILGLIGNLPVKNFEELKSLLKSKLNYEVKFIKKHDRANRIALITGGGFIPSLIQQAKDANCDVYVTGIITPNASEWSQTRYPATRAKIDAIDINIIGASHYLTEKFAPQLSLEFFKKLGYSANFIEDETAKKQLE
ncbi:MAG: Nif3-like dinuclear metal center hexameric protein [Candidatus Abawacabacteria bacterium]|nr:Nif3-like dinuclear metal center hexameric protein [Candidatus Abawacabacteria bacterium]